MRPTRLVALVLLVIAVATAAFDLPWPVPVTAVVALAGAYLADSLVARRARASLERDQPGVLARRRPISFSMRADVEGGRRVRLRQPRPPEVEVTPNEVAGPSIEGTLVGRHRGVHDLPPAAVRFTGPLGLASDDRRIGPITPVTVWPDLPGARRMAIARRRGLIAEEGRIRARLGIGTEFETVRDYSPDDDIRQVNWIATARAGKPMSNQYRIDENRDLFCVVDAGRLMASPAGGGTRLDVALDAVAALAVAAEEAGDRVGTVAFADTVSRVVRPRRRGAEAVVQALFDLEPTMVESRYDSAFQLVGGHKRCLVAVFTDVMDDAAARSLTDAVPVLARRHAVMVVSSRDPDLDTAAVAAPSRPLDVFRAAAAIDVLTSQARAVALLRKMGALVVEADPDRLGAACVSGYLALKRKARI